MYRTLSELRDSINNLIEQQGEYAPCAAFVFTKNDVSCYAESEDGFPDLDNEVFLSEEDTDSVLCEVGGSDYIYEQVFEIIEDAIKIINKQ